ncbi:MAG: hypothetical protein ACE366_26970 [Bradymonadia bacterium]
MSDPLHRRTVLKGATAACTAGLLTPTMAQALDGVDVSAADVARGDVPMQITIEPGPLHGLRSGGLEILGPAGATLAWAFSAPHWSAAGVSQRIWAHGGRVQLRLSADDGQGEQRHTLWLPARVGRTRLSLLPRAAQRSLRGRAGRPEGPHLHIILSSVTAGALAQGD